MIVDVDKFENDEVGGTMCVRRKQEMFTGISAVQFSGGPSSVPGPSKIAAPHHSDL